MVVSCVAPFCRERINQKDLKETFHRFPKDEERKALWIQALKRKNFQPTEHSRLCSKHFSAESFEYSRITGFRVLSKSAIPTIFEHPENKQEGNEAIQEGVEEDGGVSETSISEEDQICQNQIEGCVKMVEKPNVRSARIAKKQNSFSKPSGFTKKTKTEEIQKELERANGHSYATKSLPPPMCSSKDHAYSFHATNTDSRKVSQIIQRYKSNQKYLRRKIEIVKEVACFHDKKIIELKNAIQKLEKTMPTKQAEEKIFMWQFEIAEEQWKPNMEYSAAKEATVQPEEEYNQSETF